MLKVGDVLWEFTKNDYNIYEIVDISYHLYHFDRIYLRFHVNVLIGNIGVRGMYLDSNQDYTKLETLFGKYYTTNEQVALNYIREHFNETSN